jgi:TM2 domain-containing membrane protein YozV
MKVLSIFLNVFFPGVGSIVLGKVGQGISQIVLYAIGLILSFTVVGAIVGIPLCIAVWIWGIVTATSAPSAPIEVVVTQRVETK